MTVSVQEKKLDPVKNRDIKYLETDISAVRAIAQAAINVELFTIPLYMVALYSIQGTHQINSKGIDYYKGRLWPGSATTATPDTANKKAFNIVFSVFVQEMLHVQMAANLAKAIGVDPSFTSSLLQDDKHGWTCYGKNKTVIPHIIDFKDTYESIEVKLDALNKKQIYLLLAIEQNENQARKKIKPEAIDKYFPTVPFANWAPNKTEKDLPRFGTIGWLYECYACYLSIEYKDGKTLWDHVYKPNVLLQRDMFNYTNTGHPAKEFPEFEPKIKDTSVAFNEAIDMMSAITDQGEGSTIKDEHGWQEGPGWQELVQELQRCFAGNQWAKNELSRLKNELPTEDILENPTIEDSYLMINLLLYQVREYLRKNPVRKNPDLLANLDRDENKIITDLLDNSNQNFTYDDWKCIIKINQRLEKEPDFNDKGEGRADGRDNVVMELKNSCQLEPYYRIILEKVMGSIDYFNGDENTLFSNNNNLRKLVEIGKFLYDNYMQEVLPVDPVLSLTRWKKNLSQNTEDEKVEDKYRPSKEALEEDYPAYTDTGGSATSRDAIARYPNSEKSHYDRFKEVQTLLYDPEFITWDTWHNRGNIWTAEMLKTDDYKPKKKIPTPKEVAGALNRLKNDPNGKK